MNFTFEGISEMLEVIGLKHESAERTALRRIKKLVRKDLNLDESIELIELSRQITMSQVKNIHTLHPKLKDSVNELLGMILQIPRLEDEDLEKAVHQIELIQQTSNYIKEFFRKNYSVLSTHIK